ncbi:MAG: DsbA family protein [SAR324 cluster bacterium]|nr:DsbA family protein [SAR324 cluster bacterium]
MEKLKTNYPVTIQWRFFPLHPEIPAEGIALNDLFPGRDFENSPMRTHLKLLMEQEGLAYNSPSRTFNTRLAQELAKWAESQPHRERLHTALYQACFVGGKNIGDINVLLQLADEVGLPIESARDVLINRRFKDVIDADWLRSREIGVTGVPAFVAEPYGIVGAQPYESLVKLVQAVLGQKNQR